MEIPLTKGQVALVDAEDFDRLVSMGSWHFDRYAKRVETAWDDVTKRYEFVQVVYMHRVIMDPPPALWVDHINGNKLDNRRANLRLVTPSQNLQNSKSRSKTSRFKGVGWHKSHSCWRAYLMVDGKQKHIGNFTDELVAARAYNHAAAQYFGPYARLNNLAQEVI